MFPRRAVSAAAGSVALVVGLTGCSLLEPSGGPEPLTGVAACALGHTWELNMADVSEKLLAELQRQKVPASAVVSEGTQTLAWDERAHVVLTSDFTVTITAPVAADQTVTVIRTYPGEAIGPAYINGDVAIPRRWDVSEQAVETVADNNGTPLEEVPWAIPSVGIDDSVGLILTCDGSTMTIQPRGSRIVQTWTR